MRKLSKKQIQQRIGEIKAQQEMLSRICKSRTVPETTAAIEAEADRLGRESRELQQAIEVSQPYIMKVTAFILYDSSYSTPQILDRAEITTEEANQRNAKLREERSSARWIPFFEEDAGANYDTDR